MCGPFIPEGGKRIEAEKKDLHIIVNENSLKERRERTRGDAGRHQIQHAYLVTDVEIDLPEKPRKNYDGTNMGDAVGPVHLTSWNAGWRLAWKDKKLAYGKFRERIGGPTPGLDKDEVRREDESVEPFSFHGLPFEFWDDFIHTYNIVGDIGMFTANCELALAFIANQKPFLGFTYNEDHTEMCYSHLREEIKKLMLDEKWPRFYDPKYVILMKEKGWKANSGNNETLDGITPKKRKNEEKEEKSTKKKSMTKMKKSKNAEKDGETEETSNSSTSDSGSDD